MNCEPLVALDFLFLYLHRFLSADALLAVIGTGTIWLIMVFLMIFILSGFPVFVLGRLLLVVFFVLPIVNHIGILIASRRHNNQLEGAVPGLNVSVIVVIFRLEKKAAIDMVIAIIVLNALLASCNSLRC